MMSKRALDTWSTVFMLGMGTVLLLPGVSLSSIGFERLLNYFTEDGWGWLCIIVALCRLAALIVNGRAAEGSPIVRVAGAVAGSAMWSMFATAGIITSVSRDAFTLGAWTFLFFVGLDLHNAIRAAKEAVDSRRKRIARAELAH